MREPRKEKTVVADLTIPLDKDKVRAAGIKAGSCFGKEWDVTTSECKICAERDICGILFRDVVDERGAEIEKESGSLFLDKANFNLTDEEKKYLYDFIKSGVTTGREFILKLMEIAQTSDFIAGQQQAKFLIQADSRLSVQGGKIWLTEK